MTNVLICCNNHPSIHLSFYLYNISITLLFYFLSQEKYEETGEMPVSWLVGKMSQLHLEVYTHNFTLNYPMGQGQVL